MTLEKSTVENLNEFHGSTSQFMSPLRTFALGEFLQVKQVGFFIELSISINSSIYRSTFLLHSLSPGIHPYKQFYLGSQ